MVYDEVVVHSPLPLTPECVGKKWRAQLLIESPRRSTLQSCLSQMVQRLPKRTKGVEWYIDVDPLTV